MESLANGDPTVDDLVFQCLERFDAEGDSAVDELCGAHPELEAVLRRRLDTLRRAGLLGMGSAAQGSMPERLGDFRLLERLGAGGMGVVYLARQESLGREVALKLIRPEQLYFAGARERFRREVETVARLQHPGIVPIYTVGEDAGVPYFAMEHVRGCTLADVLERLRGADPAKLTGADLDRAIAACTGEASGADLAPAQRGSWIDACVHVVREVADALEHAHRLGVVHRDIKPSNVMVTRAGRIMLLDFGLASSEGAGRLTRSGSHVGSLPYMSPEQLRPAPVLDRRADVYGLGVTLYELLTLDLPYEAATTPALIARILGGGPRPVRSRNSRVPWELETVCATAMELGLERRYASAAALARDLSNVLEHRPIAARRAGPLLRARRWTQRHPARAVGALFGAVVVVGGPLVYAWLQYRASERMRGVNVELTQALRDSDVERARAREHLERSIAALQLLTRVGADELASVPQASETRRRMLEAALGFWRDFAARSAGDPELLVERARAARASGQIESRLGRRAEAEAALRESVASYEAAESHRPGSVPDVELAETLQVLGRILRESGEVEDAGGATERAMEVLAGAPRAATAAGEQHQLALALFERGELERVGGRLAASEATLREALRLLEELLAADPRAAVLRFDLARTRVQLGWTLADDSRDGDAEETYASALELLEVLHADDPREPLYREWLAAALVNLGTVAVRAGRLEEADGLFADALRIDTALAADYPDVPKHREELAALYINRGMQHSRAGERERALECWMEGERLLAELVEGPSDAPEIRGRLATARLNLGGLLRDMRRTDEALGRLELARQDLAACLAANPDHPNFQTAMRYACVNHAQALFDAGRYAEAVALVLELPYSDQGREVGHAALLLARCIPELRLEPTLAGEAAELEARCARRAIEYLRLGLEKGTFAIEDLESPDFEPLRALPEFQELGR